MRFYALSTDGIDRTYRALQQQGRELRGSTGASRCLRVAQLYGHLQFRAREGREVHLVLRDLAAAWHLQPRLLREDLQDLRTLGWLTYSSGIHGTRIYLNEPLLEDEDADLSAVAVGGPEPQEAPQACKAPGSTLAPAEPEATPATEPEPSAEPDNTPPQSSLIAQFVATYNQHKPQTWPAYNPTGSALASRLQKAIRHAGGAEAFWAVLISALRHVPEFWRLTYPQGRNGADCAMALLSADRKAAGLGVEFWHVFCWGNQGQTALSTAPYSGWLCGGIGGNTPEVGSGHLAVIHHPDFARARKLLVWGDHAWRCQGMEAFDLPASEKQRLAELLEAAGLGEPGKAAEQFAQEARR
ncbi:MAG: hypothetical protein RLZZ54_781 [Cyanobacteriota bacterium]|jgi:hypothetical protein